MKYLEVNNFFTLSLPFGTGPTILAFSSSGLDMMVSAILQGPSGSRPRPTRRQLIFTKFLEMQHDLQF